MKNLDSDKTVVSTIEGAAKYIYSYNNINKLVLKKAKWKNLITRNRTK